AGVGDEEVGAGAEHQERSARGFPQVLLVLDLPQLRLPAHAQGRVVAQAHPPHARAGGGGRQRHGFAAPAGLVSEEPAALARAASPAATRQTSPAPSITSISPGAAVAARYSSAPARSVTRALTPSDLT